ncbi:MAG: SLC13 family permease [Candidatus Heimdallarchaeota archaeon]
MQDVVGPDKILVLIVFLFVYILIMTEIIERTVAALIGAVLMVFYQFLSMETALEELHENLSILLLIIGMYIIVEVTKDAGLFQYLTVRILKASGGEPIRLLVLFCALGVGLSIFLSNVASMVIIGSLTLVVCEAVRLDPKPYLISEALIMDVGGLTTIVSSIPNMIVGRSAGYDFVTFFLIFAPFVLIASITAILICRRVFIKELIPKGRTRVRKGAFAFLDEWEVVEDKNAFYRASGILILVLACFIIGGKLGPPFDDLGFIAIMGAILALFLSGIEPKRVFNEIEWSSLFFFGALFIVVKGAAEVGLLTDLAHILANVAGESLLGISLLICWIGGIASSLVDNIPISVAFLPVIEELPRVSANFSSNGAPHGTLWLSLIMGANLGGNFTPIGSPSNIIALNMYYGEVKSTAKQKGFFKTFFLIGVLVSVVLMIIATIYIILSRFLTPLQLSALSVTIGIVALVILIRPWERFRMRKQD